MLIYLLKNSVIKMGKSDNKEKIKIYQEINECCKQKTIDKIETSLLNLDKTLAKLYIYGRNKV